MDLKIIYEDNSLLVVDKPAGLPVFEEGNISGKVLADYLIKKYPELKKNEPPHHNRSLVVGGEPPRYGIVHRLDKDTSGILLVARSSESLIFFQKQFKNRRVEKRYLALVVGQIKDRGGTIETLIGRSPRDGKKQKVFLPGEPGSQNKRQAITEYRVLEKYNDFTLLEVVPKTGRKHQIRCHLASINHPIAGDKMYGFKNQPTPPGLTRHFLHANYLRIELPNKETRDFKSELPEDLTKVLEKLK